MDNLISRRAAIDAIYDWWTTVDDNRHPVDVIKAVPSAQRDAEIVRCKDCKWFGKVGCAVMIADRGWSKAEFFKEDSWMCTLKGED